jgi:2,4-dienoyl-CoA reductase-like NADH-dependent reductase (Old Yellow Enzyme family)
MSILFQPFALNKLTVRNRFVHSATVEGMATEHGEVTDAIIRRYRALAKGTIGLIIPGTLFVHPSGRAFPHGMGIHDDSLIPGLRRLADTVHEGGGKIAFQLMHGGRQTTRALAGQTPWGPSSIGRDPANLVKPKMMSEEEIHEVIEAFGAAARRAVEAGVDGIQIHAAHGYLVNQFLSPFFNRRADAWGGSDENRFRFLKEVSGRIRKEMPRGMPLLIKLSTADYTPKQGVTPELAARYAAWLADLGVDGIEASCGTSLYSPISMCRGVVPVRELARSVRWWARPVARVLLRSWVGKFELEQGYNLAAAGLMRQSAPELPIMLVGGMRRLSHMEEIVQGGKADFISMCRPFIREPDLVNRMSTGSTEAARCTSCNKCFAALANHKPVRCYAGG